jgi:hypothetical protein
MKLITVLFFSTLFIFVIVAPTSCMLLDFNQDLSITFNINDEEHKDEGEKEFQEKEVYFYESYSSTSFMQRNKPPSLNILIERYDDRSLEVFLPPPRMA